ncbi:MAG TPA: O-methyltransferase [Solirubrobacteraceae bacterium]|nr:O-methyltransferase [Solirubrobacteraceae bacterium]
MSELIAAAAEAYAAEHTTPFEGALKQAAGWTEANTEAPQMMAGLAEARLLQALIAAGGARRVLEIGTFTGVGTLAMAAALPDGGRVTTLEVDPERAAIAQGHFEASPHTERIELILGDAQESLARLDGPFDLVWIDAWKADYPAYYNAVIEKLADRGVIVADNLFRGGGALSGDSGDPGTAGIQEFARRVQADERTDNVLLTIGDGVMLAWLRPGGR